MFRWRFLLVSLLILVSLPMQALAGRLPLWEASSVQGTVYLFGSVHVCKASCFPLPAAVLSRMDASKVLVVELDPRRPDASQIMLGASMLLPGQRLSDRMAPEKWKDLVKASIKAKVPSEALEPMQPWMADMMLGLGVAQQSGYDVAQGIDLSLMLRGEEHGLALEELETVESQVAAVATGSPEEQIAALQLSVTQVLNGRAGHALDELVQAWKEGDAKAIDRLMRENQPANSTQARALIEERNRTMSEKIVQNMADGRTRFVVVGVAHLVGVDGIPAQLQQRGFKVRQLTTEDR